jgi:hypothetical protein
MALWTDLIDPATLTGYARASLADYEQRQGTLARWLPNREVLDITVRFTAGQTGLVDVANFRAYDAEPEIGSRPEGKRVTIDLPAISNNIPVSEYDQLRLRGDVDETAALAAIQRTTDLVVRSVSDSIESMRGIVLATGKATIDQFNYQSEDDFARPAAHQVTAPNLWTTGSVSRLDYLEELREIYVESTGQEPGAILTSRRIMQALRNGDEMATQLVNAAQRPATESEVRSTVSGAGLPDLYVYDRRVRRGGVAVKAIPDDLLLMLPAPVDPDDWQGTQLGATFWGQTLTSTDSSYAIEVAEQPGIVAGVYRGEKPPMIAEVLADAIALPVLANAELSLAAKVL